MFTNRFSINYLVILLNFKFFSPILTLFSFIFVILLLIFFFILIFFDAEFGGFGLLNLIAHLSDIRFGESHWLDEFEGVASFGGR